MRIEDHIEWARNVALQYRRERNIPIDYEEAISLGTLGLIEAARAYKECGIKFRSFAWNKVRGRLRDWVRMSMANKRLAQVASLEVVPVSQLPSVNGAEKKVANKELVRKILVSIGPKQAYILKRYYLDGFRMREIGAEIGVTESRVSQILTEVREGARRIWARQI